MRARYRGFSLHQFRVNQTTKLTDIELVKLNLLTHIYTRKGERLMMSTFGTRIPDLIYEQMTPEVVQLITEDLNYVFAYDPRIQLLDLQVVPYWNEGVVLASARIKYLEFDIVEGMEINIEFED